MHPMQRRQLVEEEQGQGDPVDECMSRVSASV
jgi:hypothetical protein